MEDDSDFSYSTPRNDEHVAEHHTHHHHHHHPSAYESPSYHSTHSHHHHSRDEYEEGRFYRSHSTASGIVLTFFLLLLVCAPIFFFFADKNEKLKHENIALRTEIFRLTEEISSLKKESLDKEPLSSAETQSEKTASRTTIVDTPEKREIEKENKQTLPPLPPASQAIKPAPSQEKSFKPVTGMSAEEQAALCQEIRLAPNGTALDFDGTDAPTRRATGCMPALETAFYALSQGQVADAAVTLESLANSKPLWPYGHFYLAIANQSQKEFRHTQKLLLNARLLKAITPEGEIYLVLTSLFLKDMTTAKETLARLETTSRDYSRLPLGPLYIPKAAPDDLTKRLKALQGLPELHVINDETGPH